MQNARKLLVLGIWVAILPYLGFPLFWKNVIFSISGLGLIYLSYVLYAEHRQKESGVKTFENFAENNNFEEKEI